MGGGTRMAAQFKVIAPLVSVGVSLAGDFPGAWAEPTGPGLRERGREGISRWQTDRRYRTAVTRTHGCVGSIITLPFLRTPARSFSWLPVPCFQVSPALRRPAILAESTFILDPVACLGSRAC